MHYADVLPGSIGLILNMLVGQRQFWVLEGDILKDFRKATSNINELTEIEQYFDILLSSFVELEQELATRGLERTYRSGHSLYVRTDDMQAFNRRLMSFLTSSRLYIDRGPHHIRAMFPGDRAAIKAFASALEAERTDHLAFRVMERLRNYAQHQGLPLESVTTAGRWLNHESPELKMMESKLGLNLNAVALASERNLTPEFKAELTELGSSVDITMMIRQYMEGLGRVHSALRERAAPLIVSTRQVLDATLNAFKETEPKVNGPTGIWLVQIKYSGRGHDLLEPYPHHSLEYLEILQSRSNSLVNFSRHFHTTAPT